jgi:hypothetical protein
MGMLVVSAAPDSGYVTHVYNAADEDGFMRWQSIYGAPCVPYYYSQAANTLEFPAYYAV